MKCPNSSHTYINFVTTNDFLKAALILIVLGLYYVFHFIFLSICVELSLLCYPLSLKSDFPGCKAPL